MDRSERIGAYRVTELLAQGASSYVVAAVHEGPGGFTRPVAMKTLRGAMARVPSQARDFLFEARAAASVTHPHVVQVHGLLEERDRTFLIMELVRGWSVRAMCATLALTRRCAAYEIAVALVRDAALGVHALHDAGVLHRDLSPDNLLVAASGHVKIVDFGAASWDLIERVRARPAPLVDVAYAAPETTLGLRVDRPCDVYTLGAVLHELCLGVPPIAASGWPHRRGAGAAPMTDDLPDGLGSVLERALRYAASERFATAADLAQALDDVAAHHGWRTSPPAIAAYLSSTFATRSAARPLVRRPPSEPGRTRVRLRRAV
jgi:serine/threonine-protein kinase